MKIFYAASTASHIESFHLPYLRWLCARGDEVCVAAPARPEGLPEGARWYRLPLKKSIFAPENFLTAVSLAGELRRGKYDIISTHTTLAAYFVRLAVKLAGIGRRTYVVNTVHGYLFGPGTPFYKRWLLLLAEKSMAPVTHRVVTMNARDLALAKKHRLSREDVVPIEGMGVRFRRFAGSPERRTEARHSLGLKNETVLVFAGEFSDRKDQAFLIKAMKKLPADWKLLLPGTGGRLSECKALVQRLGLGSRVLFPGHMDDVERAYFAADIFVSASRSEGLPFGMMEAMRAGLAPVASDVAGQQDLVEQGWNGLLYPRGDETAYIRALAKLVDPARRRRLGKRAARMVQRYDARRVFAANIAAFGYLRPPKRRKKQ